MNIVVTGGAGFIGSNVADAYINLGHRVIIIDDLSTGKKENINPHAEFHHLSVHDPAVEDIFKNNKIDILNHHAAQIDVRRSVREPALDGKINIIYPINLLEYCRKYAVKKVIYSSTGGALYGNPRYSPCDENHPIRPVSPYGISKYCLEHYIEYYYDMYGVDYTILRYANVYGPRQDPLGEAGVVAIFTNILLNGETPVIYGDGEQTRDFVYIGDVVRANIMALDSGSGGKFNVGTGLEISVNKVYQLLISALNSTAEARYAPERPGEVRAIALSSALIKEKMGWTPEVSLEEGIKRTVDFFLKQAPIKF